MEDRDRLRREQAPPSRKSRALRTTAKVGAKAVVSVAKGLGSFITRGGVRHPDSMITRGSNRSLYIPSGHPVSPVPGRTPRMDKSILVGSLDSNPGTNRPRPRPKPSQRRPKRRTTPKKTLGQARRFFFG